MNAVRKPKYQSSGIAFVSIYYVFFMPAEVECITLDNISMVFSAKLEERE